jgi:hypothetical protein
MIRTAVVSTAIACFAVMLMLLLLALGLRLAGEMDADGQVRALGTALQPNILPIGQLRVRIDEYLENEEWATIVYAPWLGWAPSPNRVWEEGSGNYSVNSDGMRGTR